MAEVITLCIICKIFYARVGRIVYLVRRLGNVVCVVTESVIRVQTFLNHDKTN